MQANYRPDEITFQEAISTLSLDGLYFAKKILADKKVSDDTTSKLASVIKEINRRKRSREVGEWKSDMQ